MRFGVERNRSARYCIRRTRDECRATYWLPASSALTGAGALSPDHSSHTRIEFAGFFDEYFNDATPIRRCGSAGR